MTPIHITHYSDTLCVWAYVAQIRIDELLAEFGGSIEMDYRLFPVFGNARQKIELAWGREEGRIAYCKHVRQIAEGFDHVVVHPDIWVNVTPRSSLPSHLYLCAIRLLEKDGEVEVGIFAQMAWAIRKAFFAGAQDISDGLVLRGLIDQAGIPIKSVENRIMNGEAYAAMAEDMKLAHDQMIKASPTLTFNEDRQRLTGNVGYRIIEANIRELMQKPEGEQSWC